MQQAPDQIRMQIPGFQPITLEDKQIFNSFFKSFPPLISEYTFTNLYMWRNYYQFTWQRSQDHLLLIAQKDPKKFIFFPPIGPDPGSMISKYQEIVRKYEKPGDIHRIPETLYSFFSEHPDQFEIIEDRNQWDYVYSRESLVSLAGGDLFNERKKLNKFKRFYPYEYLQLDDHLISDCKNLQESWCSEYRDCFEDMSLIEEHNAIMDILTHHKELDFRGGIIKIEGKIAAFELGEPLNADTMVIHIEKANPEIPGCYQAINQQFAEKSSEGFQFINREQDLGEPNLRRAKEGYHPVKMNKKWIIHLK
jgi:hypothetical protein